MAAGSKRPPMHPGGCQRSGVTGILFTQRQAVSPVPPPLIEEFWAGINAATASGW